MSGDFLDTSASAKYYHTEAGSAEIDQLWNDLTRQLFVSRLAALEIISVFAAKVRAGVITQMDFDMLRSRFTADLTKTKRILVVRIVAGHYQDAERLLRKHAPARRLRTLDALQLAVALDLHRKRLVDRIVSADKDMLVVADLEGLEISNPQNP
jgi:predicted nucleic acid-binding protein